MTTLATTRADLAAGPGFAELGLPDALVAVLAGQGLTEPFPIQVATIPDALAGRDVLGRARTGSGKTLAFALPALARLAGLAGGATVGRGHRSPGQPRALVLVPTRELATQVAATVGPLAKVLGLRTTTLFGGVGQGPQVAALRRGVDLVVATPGRLEDLIGQGHCHLDGIVITVLDEADHMADLGFLPAVKRLLDRTPSAGQRLLFSATLDGQVDTLVRRYLHDPVTHSVDDQAASPPELDHHLFLVQPGEKLAVVSELAAGRRRTLFFTRTKHGARKLARTLSSSGVSAVDLQGNLSQSVRNRNLAAFTDGSVRVLVATDIAARGIHVDEVALVVHVDPPAEHKGYLHRSGRTARAGAAGSVVTIVTPEQVRDVKAMVRKAGVKARSHDIAPGSPVIRDLRGAPAEVRHAKPAAPAEARQARPAEVRRARPAAPGRGATAPSGSGRSPHAQRSRGPRGRRGSGGSAPR